eukprot:TRINITY_DN48720_c0_g1_i1.p1 TRINITY_DN48720_c0_g1~~TRINITY_DN48720_c0_g1_i1.p1  ORF type:complete len:415 (-),score=61.43 TRINITY_DN48720_c0_g1_i1:96-1298(-)
MGQGLAVNSADPSILQEAKNPGTSISSDGDLPGLLRKAGDTSSSGKNKEIRPFEHIWRKAAVRMFCGPRDRPGRAIASSLVCVARVSDPLASASPSLAGHLFKIKQSPESKRQEYLRRLGIQPVSRDAGKRMPVGEYEGGLRENRLEPYTSYAVKQDFEFLSPTGPRGSGDFRRSFLSKLSYQKVWLPKLHRAPMHNTLIIFDWDDTLLCSSFLFASKRMMYCSGPSVTGRLAGVARAARETLALAKRFGETIIITNAAPSWVQQSARKYLPHLVPELQGMEIISARQRYERDFPNDISEWKAKTFLEIQKRKPEAITNLVSVGDSPYEIDAALAIGELFPQAVVKTVKFRELPIPEELEKELQLVRERLQSIVESGQDLQVALEQKSFPNTDLNQGADC